MRRSKLNTFYKGKTVLLTGAAGGIGRAFVSLLAPHCSLLILVDQNHAGLSEVCSQYQDAVAQMVPVVCDVADRSSLQGGMQRQGVDLATIDIVIANAGITKMTFVEEFNADDCRRIHAVNFFGAVHTIDLVLGAMRERGHGHIVGVASLVGIRGMCEAAYYSSSKGALMNFLESLRIDLKGRGVYVTTAVPGFVATTLNAELEQYYKTPMIEPPEKVAQAILRGVCRRQRLVFCPWYHRFLAHMIKLFSARLWEFLCVHDPLQLRLPQEK